MSDGLKYTPVESKTYKKSIKKIEKRGNDLTLIEEPIMLLAKGEKLPPQYKDHKLKGSMSKYREFHIKDDWVLIYQIVDDRLILYLHSTGTHTDLLEKT